MVVLLAAGGVVTRQLLKQLALHIAEPLRQIHGDRHALVTPSHRIPELGNAQVRQGEHRAGLGAGRDVQLFAAIHGFHLDGVAENRLEVADLDLGKDVETVPLQSWVVANGEEDVKVA